jgi:hypothetical protein
VTDLVPIDAAAGEEWYVIDANAGGGGGGGGVRDDAIPELERLGG